MLCQRQVSTAGTSYYIPHILWDVIICPCACYQLLPQPPSYNPSTVREQLLSITLLSIQGPDPRLRTAFEVRMFAACFCNPHRPYLICDPDTDPYRPNRGGVGMLHLMWQPNDCTWYMLKGHAHSFHVKLWRC